MGRPKKQGLLYFPLDCDFFTGSDRRVRRLISRFGSDGALFYIYILCECYSNGYYVEYTDAFRDDAAADLGCSPEKIGLMVNYLLELSLLDRTLFNTVKVLSSHGIQTQFQESCKGLRRDVEVDARLWLLGEETMSFIQVRPSPDKSGKNPGKSGKNPGFSGKNTPNEKEIKENKRKGKGAAPTLQEIVALCRERGYTFDPVRFHDYYAKRGGIPADWQDRAAAWQATEYRGKARVVTAAESAAAPAQKVDMESLRRIIDEI